jgi:hypothetical protein
MRGRSEWQGGGIASTPHAPEIVWQTLESLTKIFQLKLDLYGLYPEK